MHNPMQGETSLTLNGEVRNLRLTLGALSALETALGEDTLSALIERLSQKQMKTEDIIKLLNAGLYGAGHEPNIQDCEIKGGAGAAAKAALKLLSDSFSTNKTNAL